MDRWQYLMVLGACLVVTLPLELFGRGVYRQPRRLAAAVLPVAAVFIAWDAIAVAADVWWYDERYLVGLVAPGELPLEELLFFVVVPICGLLTYSAVSFILAVLRALLTKARQR
ncbi:lycopene cyclase domain-containing protein [Mycolicibacterium komossense]|jgi:lycopene cyclase domain-containing protein|uniref:Lycopene cyclase domain-containing protein n=1 Tax=Mycolicibacterium komossense TaxID=1779 RepID=A0ABT3CMS3_9MYCO|nr:lycopene cyclase domain-containing protein [Mycolicibacterium komossense]MCV7230740.1 lycopene cyclase domain-containing protein [Mycolicibacterium komossense]